MAKDIPESWWWRSKFSPMNWFPIYAFQWWILAFIILMNLIFWARTLRWVGYIDPMNPPGLQAEWIESNDSEPVSLPREMKNEIERLFTQDEINELFAWPEFGIDGERMARDLGLVSTMEPNDVNVVSTK